MLRGRWRVADLFPETTPALSEQIAELRRELAMRERKYPGWVSSGMLTKARADRQMGCLRAAVATLEKLLAASDRLT